MVVPLIMLGTATKLAFAVAATHRTRAWWLPGAIAMVLGLLACLHPGTARTLGEASLALGAAAVVVARVANRSALS